MRAVIIVECEKCGNKYDINESFFDGKEGCDMCGCKNYYKRELVIKDKQ